MIREKAVALMKARIILKQADFDDHDSGNKWALYSHQSHYREVPRWQIFMEQELRYGLDLGRLALLKKKIGPITYEQL